MALQTKTISSKTSSNGYTLELELTEESTSIADNTSSVAWRLILKSGAYSFSQFHVGWSVSLAGTMVSSRAKADASQIGVGQNSSIVIASGTATIKHNNDGSLNMTAAASIDMNSTSYTPGAMSLTGTMTLTTIARASSFGTVSGNTIGSSMTVNITRKSNSFTHYLYYKLGNSSWYNVGTSIGTSATFTVNMELCSQIPNNTSGTLQLLLRTYSGSTQIGSDVYKSITVYVPSSVVPTVSLTVSDPTGYLSTYGAYIQGKSKLSISISAAGSYSSTISSYKTTADGKTYTKTPITSEVISGSGTLTISTTVTDSRGRTATVSKTISVLAYSAPKITAMTVARCNANGTRNNAGAYLAVQFSASITALNNKNSAAYTLQYKKASESYYTSQALTAYAGKYSVTNGTYILAADTGSSYDVVLIATDDFGSTKKGAPGSSVFRLISWLEEKTGLAIGKVAEIANLCDVNLQTRFRKAVTMDTDLTAPRVRLKHSSSGYTTNLGVGTSSMWETYYDAAGTILNKMDLWSDRTTFTQPVSLTSGGTGAKTAADAIKNLKVVPDRVHITGQTLDIDTLTGVPITSYITTYICASISGSANITNIPVTNTPFILDVEIVRFVSDTDYITRQRFADSTDKKEYIRWCTSGKWGDWIEDPRNYVDKKVNIVISTTGNASYQVVADNWSTLPNDIWMISVNGSKAPFSGFAAGYRTGNYGHYIYIDYSSTAIHSVQMSDGTPYVKEL